MSGTTLNSKNRLCIIAGGLVPVIMVLIALNLGLSLVFGPTPTLLARAELVDPDAVRLIAARIAAVETPLGDETASERRLAVVLGLSTARDGIDPALFQRASGDRYRLLNLAGSGGSFSELSAYSKPLSDSRLLPGVVILGVHPSWLAGRKLSTSIKATLPSAPGEVTWAASYDYGRQLQAWAVQRIWILANRVAVHAELRRAMYWLRNRIFDLVNPRLGKTVPGAQVAPWTVKHQYNGDTQASPEFLAVQLREFTASGWFETSSFDLPSYEAQVLYELLQSLKVLSPKVLLVLMPESVAFRSRVPANAVDTVTRIAQGVDKSIAILDLRDSLSEPAFWDLAHLNSVGRQQFSALLGRQLRAQALDM